MWHTLLFLFSSDPANTTFKLLLQAKHCLKHVAARHIARTVTFLVLTLSLSLASLYM